MLLWLLGLSLNAGLWTCASVEGSRKILCTLVKGVGESGQQSSFKTTNATLATLLTLKVNVFLFLGFLCWISAVQSCGGCSGTTGLELVSNVFIKHPLVFTGPSLDMLIDSLQDLLYATSP